MLFNILINLIVNLNSNYFLFAVRWRFFVKFVLVFSQYLRELCIYCVLCVLVKIEQETTTCCCWYFDRSLIRKKVSRFLFVIVWLALFFFLYGIPGTSNEKTRRILVVEVIRNIRITPDRGGW